MPLCVLAAPTRITRRTVRVRTRRPTTELAATHASAVGIDRRSALPRQQGQVSQENRTREVLRTKARQTDICQLALRIGSHAKLDLVRGDPSKSLNKIWSSTDRILGCFLLCAFGIVHWD